ncbi:MAG: serine/threonine-protein kinase [Micropruina sp.]|uniref:serine/threonine-protein kinase n=1 Tax=Micropruina sp. TaxID=2737536 RepID=UPI0039E6B4B1
MAEQLLAGRYRLDNEIGAGGMGRVWRARDVRLDREVAVKTVDLHRVGDASVADRFQREIILTAKLTSPYTVTVFDGGVDGATAYLVMELLRGESLADAIRRQGALNLTQTLDVARQVVLGLSAAHAVGLVHRDIKPANVMLSAGRVKLLDFGIAQLSGQADPHLTAPSMTIGTAAYMSPEQASGHRVDAATDLYALGCLIMTMLTGRPPFDGDQALVVASNQINTAPPRLLSRRPDAPPALDALVARLLSKNPLERPDTAATLRALEQIQADPRASTVPLPPPAAPPTQPPTAPPMPRPGTAPMPQTRPYTQVNPPMPAATAQALRHLEPSGSWWIAGILVSLMAAILAGSIAANLAGTAATQLFSGQPTRSTSPSGKSSSTKPTASKTPTASAKPRSNTPDPARSVGLAVALQGVRAALLTLADSDAKAALLDQWEVTAARIAAGQSPSNALTGFDKAIKASDLKGWEQQVVLTATGAVRALL